MNTNVKRTCAACVACCALIAGSAPAQVQSPGCPADFDCNGQVDVFDLLHLLGEWGSSGSNADLTGDDTVNVFDLLELLAVWGPCLFEYADPPAPNMEAWQISVEMLGPSGPLLPPDDIYERVDRDLDLIRDAFPELVGVTHVPAWVANQLITSYQPSEPHEGVTCLLTYYQGTVVNVFFGHMHVIQFAGKSNMAAMSAKFAALSETAWAEPDGLIGGDNFWVPTEFPDGTWLWDIDNGWHDCFDGCDCHKYYVIRTTLDGQVQLVSYEEVGFPWCTFDN